MLSNVDGIQFDAHRDFLQGSPQDDDRRQEPAHDFEYQFETAVRKEGLSSLPLTPSSALLVAPAVRLGARRHADLPVVGAERAARPQAAEVGHSVLVVGVALVPLTVDRPSPSIVRGCTAAVASGEVPAA